MADREPFVKEQSPSGSPFDVQGFKDLLGALKHQRKQLKGFSEVTPEEPDLYNEA